MAVIAAFDLYRFYHAREEETLALRGVSIHVEQSEIVVVMGASGSGKSTLLACLSGLDEPDGGYVTLMGKRLTRRPEAERARMRAAEIGVLLQSGNLFEYLSVEDNIRLQMHLAHKLNEQRLDELIDLLGLYKCRKALPSQLSGGEAARAGLAVALAAAPSLLLADEPTGEVDAETERQILKVFKAHSQQGGSTLIATHSNLLAAHADRVVLLQDGIVNDEARTPSKKEGASSAHNSSLTVHSNEQLTINNEPGDGGATAFRERKELPSSPAVEMLVEARNVRRTYQRGDTPVVALASASCAVAPGDRIALVGPSGSGKSTLLHLLGGLDTPTSGTIAWPALGSRTSLGPAKIAFVFQMPSLLAPLTVVENVELPLLLGQQEPYLARKAAIEVLEQIGLSAIANSLPEELSGGQAQRVAVARALVYRPKLILADEPTGQLDRATAELLFDVLLATLEGTDTALVVATHDKTVAERLQRKWYMHHGNLIANSD